LPNLAWIPRSLQVAAMGTRMDVEIVFHLKARSMRLISLVLVAVFAALGVYGPIPEPGGLVLALSGLALLMGIRRVVNPRWAHVKLAIVGGAIAIALLFSDSTRAQFSTVINLPPNPAPSPDGIGSNTQINVLAGGAIGDDFRIGSNDGTVSNVELNVQGGTVGWRLRVRPGATANIEQGDVGLGIFAEGGDLNISGGTISGRVVVNEGSQLDMSGGSILLTSFGSLEVYEGVLNLTGGVVHEGFQVAAGAIANLYGGRFGPRANLAGGALHMFGGEFLLNGAPIAGLDVIGDSEPINIPANSVLSGTLADGSTFALDTLPIYHHDTIVNGVLTLHRAAVADAGPATIDVPSAPAPNGIRGGQTVNLGAGGSIGYSYNVSPGGTLNVMGGTVDYTLEAVAATVNLSAGSIGTLAAFRQSQIHVSGGVLGDLELTQQSEAQISGGTVGDVSVTLGSEVEITNGHLIESLGVGDGGLARILGGTVDQFVGVDGGGSIQVSGGAFAREIQLDHGALAEISGGKFAAGLRALAGSEVRIIGSEFALDGDPIEGLSPGESLVITETDKDLSGVLRDGTPFEFRLGQQCDRGCTAGGIDPGAQLTISLAAVPEPSALLQSLVALAAAARLRRGGALRG